VASKLTQDLVRPISAEEVAHFKEFGWVKLDQLIDTSLAASLLETAQELLSDEGKDSPARQDTGILPWEDYLDAGRDGIEPVPSLVFSTELGRAAWTLGVRRPGVGVRHWLDRLTCREPVEHAKQNKPTSAHQDGMLMFDRVGYVNFWIALDEVPSDRGSLRFYSGSNRVGPLGNLMNDDGFFDDILTVYPELREECPLSEPIDLHAGDATAHSNLTIHEAPVNSTSEPRWALIALYFPEDARYVGGPVAIRSRYEDVPLEIGRTFDHPDFRLVYKPE
jgi:hypothetical protein